VASSSDKLLPRAVLGLALCHEVIHGSLHILHVQSTTVPDQLLDIKFPKPGRASVVGYIQGICTKLIDHSLRTNTWHLHPCNAYAAMAGEKVVGIWPWGPPCIIVIRG
jgi:hypothetical protein